MYLSIALQMVKNTINTLNALVGHREMYDEHNTYSLAQFPDKFLWKFPLSLITKNFWLLPIDKGKQIMYNNRDMIDDITIVT